MITAGLFDSDCGIVLVRQDFELHGISQYADACGEHYLDYEPMGRMKSCPNCSRLVRDLDAIVFWKFPEIFAADNGKPTNWCRTCLRGLPKVGE